ncbi:hypothetical protein LSH36_374g01015 [Paralvinella palmiformis]|uniref:Calponin-homology (CH) domain-containing protein n=1 Tax=Paralvinella palmiformis TaxID=53620 RepID=A0AAD9JEG7_9ANNE|nr:hypothetical protein LSH36_374g01015 [Paralvinella palmiformis]
MSRAKKAGDAAQLEKKLEQKYDEIEAEGTPKAVVDWIHEVLEGKIKQIQRLSETKVYKRHQLSFMLYLEHDTWCENARFINYNAYRFLNKMLQADGKKPIEFNPKAKSTFIAMGNIQAFNDGAKHYGVPVTELFQSADLYEGRKAQMLNVINCLNKLGFVANKKQFKPQFSPPAPPKADWAREEN